MTPTLILAAGLAAAPLPVQPQFHPVDAQPKTLQQLDKQLARPAPVLFQSRLQRGADGQWRMDCQSTNNAQLKSMPDFGLHLRRR